MVASVFNNTVIRFRQKQCRYLPFLSVKEGKNVLDARNNNFHLFAFLKSFSVFKIQYAHDNYKKIFVAQWINLLFTVMEVESSNIVVVPCLFF